MCKLVFALRVYISYLRMYVCVTLYVYDFFSFVCMCVCLSAHELVFPEIFLCARVSLCECEREKERLGNPQHM